MANNEEPIEQPEISADAMASWKESADPMLANILTVSDIVSFSVTIYIPGAEVSGELIGASEFSEEITSDVLSWSNDSGLGGEEEQQVQKLFRSMFYLPKRNELTEELQDHAPRFLHLKNVKVVGNGWLPVAGHGLKVVRIPLAKVTAWTVGKSQ
nr:hypothetical protein [Corynebacterium sp. UBA5992]